MKQALRLSGQVAIILFVLWHGYAVAVYAVPREATDRISRWVIEERLPEVTPYMLQTSQWQLWNLFSPDPLRRVTSYHVEKREGETWTPVESIRPGTYSIWRHATRFKLYGNLLDEFSEINAPLDARFLQLKCEEHGLARGTPVRLQYEYYVIPKHERRQSRAWWDAWRPQPQRYTGFETFCF